MSRASAPEIEVSLRDQRGALHLDVQLRLGVGWTVLFGPSGSGKSTILRITAGLDRPMHGRVLVAGVPVLDTAAGLWTPPHRRGVRMVAQRPGLFPGKTVRRNVEFGATDASRVAEVAHLCDVDYLLDRNVGQLSGGERQRVAVARTLAADDARCLLLDEPFTGLGLLARDALLHKMQRWGGLAGVPVLLVTHDVGEAMATGGRVLRLAGGRVTGEGPAAAVLAPEREILRRRLEAGVELG